MLWWEDGVDSCTSIGWVEMLLEQLGDRILDTLQIHQEGIVKSLFGLRV